MREVQASGAKTHLPRLLDDVERGETEAEAAAAEIRAARKHAKSITVEELLSAREEGRRF